jgi:hypothetical protein
MYRLDFPRGEKVSHRTFLALSNTNFKAVCTGLCLKVRLDFERQIVCNSVHSSPSLEIQLFQKNVT